MSKFIFEAYLKNGGDLVGFRFGASEAENIKLDMTKEQLCTMLKMDPSADDNDIKSKFQSLGESSLMIGSRNEEIQFSDSETEISVDENLDGGGNYVPLHMPTYISRIEVPNPSLTQEAILNLNNFLYNTEFFDFFQLANVFNFAINEEGNVSISMNTYFPQTMLSEVVYFMEQYIDKQGIKGLTLEVDVTDKKASNIVMNLDVAHMNFASLPLNPIQMNLVKSKIPSRLTNVAATCVRDTYGISYAMPTSLDIYNRPDVKVEEVKDIVMFQEAQCHYVRFYMDTDIGHLIFLSGVRKTDVFRKYLNATVLGKIFEMLDTLPLLDEMKLDEMLLPRMIETDKEKFRIDLEVPVDFTALPYDKDELIPNMEEFWKDAVYQTGLNLSKNPLSIRASASSYTDDSITFTMELSK